MHVDRAIGDRTSLSILVALDSRGGRPADIASVRKSRQDIGAGRSAVGRARTGNPVPTRGGPAAVREDNGATSHCARQAWEGRSRGRIPSQNTCQSLRSPCAPSREGFAGASRGRTVRPRSCEAPCVRSQGASCRLGAARACSCGRLAARASGVCAPAGSPHLVDAGWLRHRRAGAERAADVRVGGLRHQDTFRRGPVLSDRSLSDAPPHCRASQREPVC